MRLPVHQVCEGHPWPAQLCIHPDTEVMQGQLRRPTRLKPTEVMGPFTIEAEGMPELLIHGLDDLTHPRPPAPEPLGPRRSAIALGRAADLGALGLPPGLLIGLPFEALVDGIWPTGRATHARQARVGIATEDKERLRQGVIFGAGSPKGKASDHPHRGDGHQQREPFIPAQAIAPADIRQAGQPARSAPLGIPRRHPGAVQGFIGPALGCHERHEVQKKGHERRLVLPHLAVELLPRGQRGKGGPQVALGIALKAPFTAKTLPLRKHRQGQHFAPAESSLRPRVGLQGQGGLAKVINHDGKHSEEGVHIDHEIAPSLGRESNSTGRRHLPLVANSHQAFNSIGN